MADYMLPEVMANFFLKAALFFAKMSHEYQNEQQTEQAPPAPAPAPEQAPAPAPEQAPPEYYVAACIFFCVASIEAYLNFLADDFIKNDSQKEPKDKIDPIYIDLFRETESKVNKNDGTIKKPQKYVSILDKIYLWPKLMTGNTFDKGRKPYQDFKKLVKFRNDMTHYKLKEADPIPSDAPDSIEIFAMLAKKGLLYDKYELNIEKAQEALRTTYQVLKDLYGFYGYKDSWTRHGLNFLNGLLEVSANH